MAAGQVTPDHDHDAPAGTPPASYTCQAAG